MAFSVGGLLLGIINHRHRGVSVAVPALVQKLYIALVVLIAVYGGGAHLRAAVVGGYCEAPPSDGTSP
jgi:hypothetical protein